MIMGRVVNGEVASFADNTKFFMVEMRANCKLQFTMLSHGGHISCASISQLSAKFSPFMKALDLVHWTAWHTTRAADAKGLPVTIC